MDRRGFLASALLAGVGGATFARPAAALQVVSCDEESAAPGCARLREHDNILAQINAVLEEQGATDAQRRAYLAAASCPLCGALLREHRPAGGF